jgi:multimeric flavodoxin WrbA
MKVILICGSARSQGNTYLALSEISKQLAKHNIESEIIRLGAKPVRGCIVCGSCKKTNNRRCVFDDDLCNRVNEAMEHADALIVGSPVYYGQPNGSVLALMQRMFYTAGDLYRNKPAAAVAVCRRGGATAALQTLLMPFQMMNMPIATSQYWNIVYGRDEGQAALDTEGMQTMRTLADNMAFLLKNTAAQPLPTREQPQPMSFIR